MGFRIATGVIPRGQLLPEGPWTLEIVALEETRDERGFRQVTMERKTVWPVRGLPDYEYYTIGTKEDPDAEQTETQMDSIGAQMLMKCLDLAGVPGINEPETDSDELFKSAKGYRFDAQCSYVTDDGSKNPADKGRQYKRLVMYKAGRLKAEVEGMDPPVKVKRGPGRPRTEPLPPAAPAPTIQAGPEYEPEEVEPAPRASGRPGLSAPSKSNLPQSRRPAF